MYPRSPISVLRSSKGQFVPIAAMVMFTSVVFLVAVVNVYKVSKEKLKVQNLADAAALNVASQMASSLNKISDLNEWMNHFVEMSPMGPSKPGEIPDCRNVNPDLPPLACAENPGRTSLNMFTSKDNAIAYARLVQSVNKAQELFAKTYNNFIGAGSNSSFSGNSSLTSILVGDIPELGNSDTQFVVWNVQSGLASGAGASNAPNTNNVQEIKFKTHDIVVGYYEEHCSYDFTGKHCHPTNPQYVTLGHLLLNMPQSVALAEKDMIGWKELDGRTPRLNVQTGSASHQPRIGSGVKVKRKVQILNGLVYEVSAESVAFVVEGSGKLGAQSEWRLDHTSGVNRPVFKPTYWVKLMGTR